MVVVESKRDFRAPFKYDGFKVDKLLTLIFDFFGLLKRRLLMKL